MRHSLRRLCSLLVILLASSNPVAGHGQEGAGDPSWLLWGKLSLLVLGAGCVAAGVYIDQNRAQRVEYADYLIIVGFLLALVGGSSLYR